MDGLVQVIFFVIRAIADVAAMVVTAMATSVAAAARTFCWTLLGAAAGKNCGLTLLLAFPARALLGRLPERPQLTEGSLFLLVIWLGPFGGPRLSCPPEEPRRVFLTLIASSSLRWRRKSNADARI